MTDAAGEFARRVLEWYDRFGRKDLPWQSDPTPYRVWVSEIMLQQTQVTTVIGYFNRFVDHFPDVHALASAPIDEVLHLWSGLGYYARARNLHRAARILVDEHGGEIPDDIDAVMALPGIGRSSAGAILALSRGRRHPILDGNVKRVLARFHAIEGWTGTSAAQRTLWSLAEHHTPAERVGEYTQAMMDLGATLCVRSRPNCDACPVREDCAARIHGLQHSLPAPRPKREQPIRTTVMLVILDGAGVLLERRPPSGIWGGLWSFPECANVAEADRVASRFGYELRYLETLPDIEHGFTHFHLRATPLLARATPLGASVRDAREHRWYRADAADRVGLAAPVERVIATLGARQLSLLEG